MMLFFCFSLLHNPLTPEDRALAYLSREVPAWSRDNKCFSCHNNGDGARALFTAVRLGHKVPDKALEETTHWLAKPENWDNNGGENGFSDKQLDRLQFGATLLAAMDAKQIKEREPLLKAAELVAAQQQRDGYWPVGPDGTVGSPATHGSTLATVHARQLLEHADATKYKRAIQDADAWLQRRPIKTVVDSAAVLLAVEKADDDGAAARRNECLALLRKGEAKEGGWGPYVNAAPEVFDTALVVLGLTRQPETEETRTWLKHGRAYLVRTQQKDGSWPETTRPSGAESYAQRISTTGWATEALLATQGLCLQK